MDCWTAIGLAALARECRAKAEIHWQADYSAEDVFDAMLRVVNKTEEFILCDHSAAKKKIHLSCDKTHRSKGEEIWASIEKKGDYRCEVFMISQSKYLEDDYGKNRENLDLLAELLVNEYTAISDEDEMLRLLQLGILSDEEYIAIIERDRMKGRQSCCIGTVNCKNCGAPIKVSVGEIEVCEYCGSLIKGEI